MEQFSLEKYLKNPSRKVVTRDGRRARIICTDRRDLYCPIIALIENEVEGEVERETTVYYTKYGKYNLNGCLSNYDLFFSPEKHEGWVNVSREEYGYEGGLIYDSKEDAEKIAKVNKCCVATIKIEWEE